MAKITNNPKINIIKADNRRAKYQVSVDIFISECQIIWSRYNALLVFNTLLFTGFGFIRQDSPSNLRFIAHFLPALGLIACYVWYATAYRGFEWIKYWISAANHLENKYLKDDDDLSNPILRGEKHRDYIAFPVTPKLALGLIICIGIVYLILFISEIIIFVEYLNFLLFLIIFK